MCVPEDFVYSPVDALTMTIRRLYYFDVVAIVSRAYNEVKVALLIVHSC